MQCLHEMLSSSLFSPMPVQMAYANFIDIARNATSEEEQAKRG